MKNIKTISAILALSLMAGLFASCGGSASSDDTNTAADGTTVPTETTADPLAAPTLPEKDFDGYEFKLLTRIEGWGIYNNEHLVVEEENGEVLNDAIYQRNRMVEDKFNVKLVEIVTKNGTTADLNSTVMSGDDSYDVILASSEPNLGVDFQVDFNSLDHINLDKPWWNQNYSKAISVNGKLTSAVSSLMITHMDSVLAMFYNKKIAADNKLPDLYELVRKGEWTLPKVFELTKNITLDLNGDGAFDDNDQYVFVGLDGIARLASGVKINSVIKDSNDIPVLNIDSADVIETITKVREYATQYERDIYNPRADKNGGGDGDRAVFRLFQNDQTLLYVHGLGSAQMFRDMESDFGVLPTPKLDTDQENYAIAPDSTKCLVIPITATDLERTAIILEYMSWAGYTHLRPQYYESMLQSKYLRDEESVEMMDEYIYTNIGFNVNSGSKTLSTTINTARNGDGEVASTIAANKSAIQEEMNKHLELYK